MKLFVLLFVMTVSVMKENHRKLLKDQISQPEINRFRKLFSSLGTIYDEKEIVEEMSAAIVKDLYHNTNLSKTKIFAQSICPEFPDLLYAIIGKLKADWDFDKDPERYLPALIFLHLDRTGSKFKPAFEGILADVKTSGDPLKRKAYSTFLEMIAAESLRFQNIPSSSKKLSKSEGNVLRSSRSKSKSKISESSDQKKSMSPNSQSYLAERVKLTEPVSPKRNYEKEYVSSTGGIDLSIPRVGLLDAITNQEQPVGNTNGEKELGDLQKKQEQTVGNTKGEDDLQRYITNLESDNEKLKKEFKNFKRRCQQIEKTKQEEIATLEMIINRLENDKKSLQESRDIRVKEEELRKRQGHKRV